MNPQLSIDEFKALDQISKLPKHARPSICVARNSKRLLAIKMITHRNDGGFDLTETGRQSLFVKQCIDGLRAIADNPDHTLTEPITTFLRKKGHIEVLPETGGNRVSARGLDCLAGIDANKSNI